MAALWRARVKNDSCFVGGILRSFRDLTVNADAAILFVGNYTFMTVRSVLIGLS